VTAGTEPALSAVLVTADRFSSIRRTVEHLRAQTVANQVELVIVRDRSASLVDAAPEELLGFNRVTVVETGPIGNVDKAAAPGMRAASGPVVAVLEDHAYPEPGWAETMIRAHRDGGWAATCSEYVNANPASPLSWANLLWAYGAWTRPARDGEAPGIARHNVAFSRDALAPLADELEDLLGRGGGLEARLREAGGRLGVVSSTHVAHINPSRLRSTIQLRFSAGRLRTGPAGAGASMAAKGPMLLRVPAGALRRLARCPPQCAARSPAGNAAGRRGRDRRRPRGPRPHRGHDRDLRVRPDAARDRLGPPGPRGGADPRRRSLTGARR